MTFQSFITMMAGLTLTKANRRRDQDWSSFLVYPFRHTKLHPHPPTSFNQSIQGVTKTCRLSLLTNSALVYESKCGGMGVGVVAGHKPIIKAVHITCYGAPKNLGDLPSYLTHESMVWLYCSPIPVEEGMNFCTTW
jgi:hypothetical protein